MTHSAERLVANMEGPEALPRKNGELVFEAPWEGRAFGMALALVEQLGLDWEEFRGRLIAEIAAADRQGEPSSYYERWLASLERLLLDQALLSRAELDGRTAEFAAGARDEAH